MKFQSITSKNNDRVKQVCFLMRSASARREYGQFALEGLRLCRDAALNGLQADELYFTQKALDKFTADVELIAAHSSNAFLVSDDVFDKMSQTDSAQGVLSVMPVSATCSVSDLDPQGRYVACADLADPGNLGAISRTAEALGVDGMLLFGNCCDPYNPKALRASMGALLRVPMIRFDNFSNGISSLKNLGLETYASVVDLDAETVQNAGFHDGCVVFVGNEANGLTDEIISLCDRRITIPINGRAESFNAAAAAAILLWELMKS